MNLIKYLNKINIIKSSLDDAVSELLVEKNKQIILVDDVITTSSTANSCAKELKKYGAKKITILTIAKTIF